MTSMVVDDQIVKRLVVCFYEMQKERAVFLHQNAQLEVVTKKWFVKQQCNYSVQTGSYR